MLEDYAHLADGLLALYEATFDERWFIAARALADAILAHFADPAGGFFDTADDHERLVTRPKDLQDNAVPSGNAMADTVLLRLAALTGEGRYREAAERAIGAVSPPSPRATRPASPVADALDFALAPVVEVAIVGDPRATRRGRLLEPVRRWLPAEPGRRGLRGPGRQRRPAAARPSRDRWPSDRLRLSALRLPAAGDGRGGTRGAARRVVSGFEIREARPDEYEPLGDLTVAAYATLPTGIEDDYADHLRNVRRRAATCPILVAVQDERLLGGVTYVPGPGTPWSEAEADDEAGFRMLAVGEDARSRGVGEALVRACVDRARGDGKRGVVLLNSGRYARRPSALRAGRLQARPSTGLGGRAGLHAPVLRLGA